MALKKIKKKCLAIGLTVVFSGGNILLASANETVNNNDKILKIEEKNKNEEIKTSEFKNKIIMENESDKEKNLNRENLSETSHVEEKEGKIYVTLNFNEKIDDKNHLEILVNDKKVNHETIENQLNKDNTSVKFEVSSLQDKITIKKNITDLNKQTKYDIVLIKDAVNEESTNKEENINKPQNNTKPVDKNIQANENKQPNIGKSENQTSQVKNIKSNTGKLSSIENTIKASDSSLESLARESLGSTSYIEEIDGKTYVQLEFVNNISKDKELEVIVNNKSVDYNTLSKNLDSGKITIKYEVPNLDTESTVMCKIKNSNGETKDIEFKVSLKKDTLKYIKDITATNINNVENSANNSTIKNLNSTKKTYNRGGQILQKPSTSGKLSSIKNDVITLSEEAEELANAQLNDITFIEEVNGKTYAIFDLVDAVESESSVKIEVNNKQVSYEILSSHIAKGRMRIKFEIPNVYADIKVKSYMESKKKDIEYNVKLINSTLKVENENSTQTNNNNNNNNNSSTTTKPKLPQTGIGFDGAMITGLGATMIVAGAALTKKKDE
ncbi:NEAT domain-containing protein [Romboutsia lituseburensis]|uniref:LPXTG-motif cell wall anchor domain-containing protein n=2 Tax=Bacteria TaxID=2 RepID=A0A1G9IMD8_9FIRM|nr:NEAT domain-containing protein [Romboutsia lituseburensis]SDL26322.1 LPXTG-motif cell wall anchor domain-containing protein [Romboutsia lituseburensis DSM 797]